MPYYMTDWEAETDIGNDDDREGVYFLTIHHPDGEEMAVVIHRVCDGRFPIDGDVAQAKVKSAELIVNSLNARSFLLGDR